MKALWQYENNLLDFREIDEPMVLEENEIKIKVLYASIGLKDLSLKDRMEHTAKTDIPGYEMTGIITRLGKEAKKKGFYEGQKVTGTRINFCGKCNNCLSGNEEECTQKKMENGFLTDYAVLNDSQCIPLEQDMPYKRSCLIEPVARNISAIKKLSLTRQDRICIFGLNFNSIILAKLMLNKGIDSENITLICRNGEEEKKALKYIQVKTLTSSEDDFQTELLKLTGFEGFSKIIITQDVSFFIDSALNSAENGASIILMDKAEELKDNTINLYKLTERHIKISTSFLYDRKTLAETAEIMKNIDAENLIEKDFVIYDAPKAFEEEKSKGYFRTGIIMSSL